MKLNEIPESIEACKKCLKLDPKVCVLAMADWHSHTLLTGMHVHPRIARRSDSSSSHENTEAGRSTELVKLNRIF